MAEYIEREAAIEAVYLTILHDGIRGALKSNIDDVPAADVVPGVDFRDCRNELCLRCGEYKTRHLGSCDGCRWREE